MECFIHALPFEACAFERGREREGKREGKVVSQQHSLKFPASPPRHEAHSTVRYLVICVTSKGRRNTTTKGVVRSCVKLAALPTVNGTALNDLISCRPGFVLRKQVFWIFALCGQVIAPNNLKEHASFVLRVMSRRIHL